MFKLTQSTILTGNNSPGLLEHARELAHDLGGNNLLIEHAEKGDKVKEIRELYRYSRGVQKEPLTFIINADSFFATVTNDPWQNAFLKLFEEPNPNIYFVLVTTKPQNLLATIRSRGQVVALSSDAQEVETVEWFELSIYGRLKVVSKTKTRSDAIQLVQAIAETAKTEPKYAGSLEIVNDTLERLTQNGNTKLQLTNLAVNL